MAIKCILGMPLQSPSVFTHNYHLSVDDIDSLVGKSVIVTGGTGAIGSAICYELAAMGATVGMCGRSKDKIENIIFAIRKMSPEVADHIKPLVLDVNSDEMIENVIKEFTEAFGGIDVFINSAGGQPGKIGEYKKKLYEQTINQIDLILNTNLRSVIMCSRVVSQLMAVQNYGHIISMSSVIGLAGKSGYCDYAAAKAGIVGFTKSLALEMAEHNVRVNCISPGTINQIPFESGSEPVESRLNPMHRTGYTREIASAVVFLMKNEFITGQNIVVDGGRTLGLYGDV
jgi:oxidoreductase, short chain dehydrogenase/reductase family protein